VPWDNRFWIVLESSFASCARNDDFAADPPAFFPVLRFPWKKYMGFNVTEFQNGTMHQGLPFAVNRASTISCLWAEVLPS
jgi:hypothetical protein